MAVNKQKQSAMKKTHLYSNRNNIDKGLYFVVEGSLAENVPNLQFLLLQQLGTVFNIFLYLEVLFFLCAIFETGFK